MRSVAAMKSLKFGGAILALAALAAKASGGAGWACSDCPHELITINFSGAQVFDMNTVPITDFLPTDGRPTVATGLGGIALTDTGVVISIWDSADGIRWTALPGGTNPQAQVSQDHIVVSSEDGLFVFHEAGALTYANPALARAQTAPLFDGAVAYLGVLHAGVITMDGTELFEIPISPPASLSGLGDGLALVIDDDSVEIYDRTGNLVSIEHEVQPVKSEGAGKTALRYPDKVVVLDGDGNVIVELKTKNEANLIRLAVDEIVIVADGVAHYFDCMGNPQDNLVVADNATVLPSAGPNKVVREDTDDATHVDVFGPGGVLIRRLTHAPGANVRVEGGKIIVVEWDGDDPSADGSATIYDENGVLIKQDTTTGCPEVKLCCDKIIVIDNDQVRIYNADGSTFLAHTTGDDRGTVVCGEGHIIFVEDNLVTSYDCETGARGLSVVTNGRATVATGGGRITVTDSDGTQVYDADTGGAKDEAGLPLIGTLPPGIDVEIMFVQIQNPPTMGLVGDVNCDGLVSVSDIGAFVLALTDPVGYSVQFPDCDINLADTNGDGIVSVGDIGAFVQLLVGP